MLSAALEHNTFCCCASCHKHAILQITATGTGASAQQLWLHPVLSSMQEQSQLKAAQLTLCSLSVAAVSAEQHRLAVLATTSKNGVLGLQLLSVSGNGKPIVMGSYLVIAGTDSDTAQATKQSSSKWHCCCSKYGKVLLHKENGPAYVWSLSKGSRLCCDAHMHISNLQLAL